jgi:hypothetical protein
MPSALTTIQKHAKISVLKATAVSSLTLRPFARLDSSRHHLQDQVEPQRRSGHQEKKPQAPELPMRVY